MAEGYGTYNPNKTMTIIVIGNQKGGAAKSTTAINLGHALHQRGKRVLMMDADQQASLTHYAGYEPRELIEEGRTLYHVLTGATSIEDAVIEDSDAPDLLAASDQLGHDTGELVYRDGKGILRDALAPLKDRYEFILIDSPPWLGGPMVATLTAADAVLVPVKMDYLSILGVERFIHVIEEIQRRDNPRLSILGVLPTQYKHFVKNDPATLAEVTEIATQRGIRVFEPIPSSTQFDQAARYGTPTIAMHPKHKVVANYHLLATHIIETYANAN